MVAQSVRENAGWQTSGWQSERSTKVNRHRQSAQWQATRPAFQFGGDSMSTEATNEWNNYAIPSLRQPEAELPEIVSAEQFLEQPQEMPAELVQGMIHQSTLTMFSGGSTPSKPFTLMDLGLRVSHGVQ